MNESVIIDQTLPGGRTLAECIALNAINTALSDPDADTRLRASTLILDRVEGKPTEEGLCGTDNPMVQALQLLMQSVVDMKEYKNGKPKRAEGDGDGEASA
jgi:hypothetical protein